MRYYDKDEIKNQLELERVFELLSDLGAEPEYNSTGIVAQTICHNEAGEGSHKLYYWENTHLFSCFTSCGTFDIFELIIKIVKLRKNIDLELYDAMCYIADYFGLEGINPKFNVKVSDIDLYEKKHDIKRSYESDILLTELKEYDPLILKNLPTVKILNWEREGINFDTCKNYSIKYEPSKQQIVIPHFDINNRLIGIRGRCLCEDDAKRYGKYRPLYLAGQIYSHPLSRNLYGIHKNAKNIARAKTAIIVESEKSVLQFESYYGSEENIVVACCGSFVSAYQIELLQSLEVKEIIFAFDRQFQEIGDKEFEKLKSKLISLYHKYNKYFYITAIFDKNMITKYKDSPLDCGKDIFEILLKNRIVPK